MPQTTDISKNVSTLRQMLEYYMWSSICLKPLTFFKHLPTTTDIFFENVTSCRQMLAHILCQVFGPSFLRIYCFLFALIWSFCFWVFFIHVFFWHPFFRLFYGATQMDPDGLGFCASRSDSQISLSYSRAVFGTNSFGLF